MKRACLALAVTLSCVAAQAGEVRDRCPNERIVLNGRLQTSDFTGGVGGQPVYDIIYGETTMVMGGGTSGGFAGSGSGSSSGSSASASASAHAFASAHISINTAFGGHGSGHY